MGSSQRDRPSASSRPSCSICLDRGWQIVPAPSRPQPRYVWTDDYLERLDDWLDDRHLIVECPCVGRPKSRDRVYAGSV